MNYDDIRIGDRIEGTINRRFVTGIVQGFGTGREGAERIWLDGSRTIQRSNITKVDHDAEESEPRSFRDSLREDAQGILDGDDVVNRAYVLAENVLEFLKEQR